MIGVGSLVSGVIIAVASPFATAVLSEDAPPCVVQVEDVSRAVKAGIDDPENLRELQRPGCSRTPEQMVADIQDGD